VNNFDSLTIPDALVVIRANESELAARREVTGDASLRFKDDGLKGQNEEQIITIYVIDSLATRDALFTREPFVFDRFSLFVWNGESDCFTPDEIGKKLMRFLVLVAKWDKHLLVRRTAHRT
jgi:hypothetical protein